MHTEQYPIARDTVLAFIKC